MISCLFPFAAPYASIGWPGRLFAGNALPSADEVMQKAVQRAKWVEEQNLEATRAYTQRSVTEQLSESGTVKDRHELLYHVYPVEGLPYAELIQKDGSAPTAQDLKKERERQKKLREKLAQRRWHRDEDDVTLNEEVVGKYRFEILGREAVNGRTAFVLSFEPRSNNLLVRRKVDRFLNKLAGTIWVDEHDYDIPKLVFHLKEDIMVGWGILASFRKLDVTFEQVRDRDGIWFPARVDTYVDGRVLFKSFHVRQHDEMTDFRIVTSDAKKVIPATK